MLQLLRGDVSVVVMVTLNQRTSSYHPYCFYLVTQQQQATMFNPLAPTVAIWIQL